MASITSIVAAIKDDLGAVLSDAFIEQCVRDAGHSWRDRQLDPVATVQLFIQQILHATLAARRRCGICPKPAANSVDRRIVRLECVCL